MVNSGVQLSLSFASMAYVLLCALWRLALTCSELARATCGTIRGQLLEIGARVTLSVWRIRIAMATAFPSKNTEPDLSHNAPQRHNQNA